MKILISPAKRLNEKKLQKEVSTTFPVFAKESFLLADIMKNKTADEIKAMMKVSDNIAELNFKRYQEFKEESSSSALKPALFMFQGDVYSQLELEDYTNEELYFTQENLRILSGLYGILKPFDLIKPYRLEMGIKLENPCGKNLYEFWGGKITEELNREEQEVVINLASEEYFKSIVVDKLKAKVVNIHFKQHKNGKIQTFGMLAKRARGKMLNYIIKNNILDVEDLKNFSVDGYSFQKGASNANNFYFFVDLDNAS